MKQLFKISYSTSIVIFLYTILSMYFVNVGFAIPANKPIPVTVKDIQKIISYPTYDAPANVISLNTSIISSELKGKLIDLPKQVGDVIKKDELIAKIFCQDYELQLSQDKAKLKAIESDLKLTEWKYQRASKLANQNNASEEMVKTYEANLDKLKVNIKSQEATIATAENDVERCSIKSPFDGVITSKKANLGEYLNPGSPLLDITDTDNLEVEALLHVNELSKLKMASEVYFLQDDIRYMTNIRTIVPIQDNKSRTQIIRLVFSNDAPLVGSAGRLTWKINTPAISSEYVRKVGNQLGIFVAKDNKARFVALPQAIEGQPAVLTQEIINPIIIDGRFAVSDGSEISIQR